MSINAYKLKKWFAMLFGKGTLYVNQGVGKHFSSSSLLGYFNDLTEKVLKDKKTLKNKELPSMKNENGVDIVFATTIFQYGLGCYDLLLEGASDSIKSQFEKCVFWAYENQDNNGGWDISSYSGVEAKYGSMAQGEGASLLLRAYLFFKDEKYLMAAERALKLMIKPVGDGGTALYRDKGIFFLEFTNKTCILNGWIFSLFGLFDYLLVRENETFSNVLDATIETLSASLPSFDTGYWSMYDMSGNITSPFYHRLHISQFEVLCMIYPDNKDFISFLTNIRRYNKNPFYRVKAFIKKCFQKVFGKD